FPYLCIFLILQFLCQSVSPLFVELVSSVAFSRYSFIELIGVFLNVLVELVKVDISQYWADNPALRSSTVRSMKYPVFHISGIQELSDKPQKSFVSDTFP